jgi:uncharacterized membrane protein YgcG
MVTADRSAPLRRVGSLLGLLGLEVAAVAALHWLGRLPALRIPWERPLPWLLDSPVQGVLGSLVRMVGLVMAYWLLASSVLYLLASLSHLPAAVRAVRWLTLPLVRRVADHAVAVTLATSMVGGGTLATAGPAGAAPGRGAGMGPPARRPVASALAPGAPQPWAAAQPTSSTAGQDQSQPRYRPRPAGQVPTTTGQDRSQPRYRPRPAGQEPSPSEPTAPATEPETTPPSTEPPSSTPTTTAPTTSQATTTEATTTTQATTTTAPAASATGPSSTAATTGPPSAQPAPTATRQPSTAAPATTATTGPAGGGTAGSGSGRQARAAGQPTTTTALRPPAYRFNPAGTTTTTTTTTTRATPPEAGQGSGQPGGEQGSGSKSGSSGGESGGQDSSGAEQATSHRVERGDNLWAIARDRLAEVSGRRSVELSDREVAAYWATVVEANRGRLRSRDPDLIYPGEVVELPPVSGR